MSQTKTLRGPQGLKLLLDRGELYHDDPGQGTPAIVEGTQGRQADCSSTYWCAADQGCLMSHKHLNDEPLTDEQCRWLNSEEISNTVEEFLRTGT